MLGLRVEILRKDEHSLCFVEIETFCWAVDFFVLMNSTARLERK